MRLTKKSIIIRIGVTRQMIAESLQRDKDAITAAKDNPFLGEYEIGLNQLYSKGRAQASTEALALVDMIMKEV